MDGIITAGGHRHSEFLGSAHLSLAYRELSVECRAGWNGLHLPCVGQPCASWRQKQVALCREETHRLKDVIKTFLPLPLHPASFMAQPHRVAERRSHG